MHRSPLVLLMSSFAIVSASTYTNPLKKNGADPAMVRTVGNATEPGYYYLLNTASHGHIEMVRSTTLDGLKDGDVQSVWSNTTPSRCHSLWAPEVHELDGIWYMYYTASAKNSAHRTPLVLKGGLTPWDKYEYLAELSTNWDIDGSVIHFPNYGHCFIWSCLISAGKPQTGANHQSIFIAPLLTASTIGPRSIISAPTNPCQLHGIPVNEGPHALYHANKTYVTFSASHRSTSFYSLGLLA